MQATVPKRARLASADVSFPAGSKTPGVYFSAHGFRGLAFILEYEDGVVCGVADRFPFPSFRCLSFVSECSLKGPRARSAVLLTGCLSPCCYGALDPQGPRVDYAGP